jgi:hypothetical protein
VRVAGWLILISLLAGCEKSAVSGPKTVADARSYAELTGLSRSPHQGLQAELVRLREERLTPLDLAAASKTAPSTRMVAVRPGNLGVQASFREAFPALSRGMHLEQIDRIDPDGDWRIGPIEREQLREFVARTAPHRDKFHAALKQAQEGFGIDPTEGPLADLEFFEPLELGCHLEGLVAVDRLADADAPAALQSLATMLNAAELLAAQQHVPCRLLAANIRQAALRLLQVIVLNERMTDELMQSSGAMLDEHLRRWPNDGQAWIGERSGGLIAYEMVRDGHFLSLIDREEMARMEKQHLVRTTARAVMGGIDEDQSFYLQSVRQMVDGCALPFCERAKSLAAIRQELASRESTQRYPIVAAKLLDDFEKVHRRQAEDLARCVAWSLALQFANGQRELSDLPLNSLTGKPFDTKIANGRLQVSGILFEADETVEVPLRREVAP